MKQEKQAAAFFLAENLGISVHSFKNTFGRKILDVGGTYPFVLFKNFPNAISVGREDLGKTSNKLNYNKWPEGKLIVSDAAHIPVADNSFDYSFSVSAIEHMRTRLPS